jgi:hypothetical protein
MYNTKDIQFVGKHDYDKENSSSEGGWNKTFSIGIFKWELKGNGKSMKKGKAIVRISGDVINKESVFGVAENVTKLLNEGNWDGRKTVVVKSVSNSI